MSSFFVFLVNCKHKVSQERRKKEASIMSTCFRKRKVRLQHASEMETSEGVSPERKEERKNDTHHCSLDTKNEKLQEKLRQCD